MRGQMMVKVKLKEGDTKRKGVAFFHGLENYYLDKYEYPHKATSAELNPRASYMVLKYFILP